MRFLEEMGRIKRSYILKREGYYRSCLERARPLGCKNKFSSALFGRKPALIAEVKKASPSLGLLTGRRAGELARLYEEAGAAAVSVLREEEYFGGSIEDVREAVEALNLPVLLKDFIIEKAQIAEAALAGASGVLLIAALLNDREIKELIRVTEEYSLEALVEVHTAVEAGRAISAGGKIIGVNARNLTTLAVDPETHFKVADYLPKDMMLVAESGIRSAGQIRELGEAGYRAFLVGGSIIKAEDPRVKIRELKGASGG